MARTRPREHRKHASDNQRAEQTKEWGALRRIQRAMQSVLVAEEPAVSRVLSLESHLGETKPAEVVEADLHRPLIDASKRGDVPMREREPLRPFGTRLRPRVVREDRHEA